MPAVSKKQQRFMGMVHAIQKGELDPSDVSPRMRVVAKNIKYQSAKEFAETKHTGLPMRKKANEVYNVESYNRELKEYYDGKRKSFPNYKKYKTALRNSGMSVRGGPDNEEDYNKEMTTYLKAAQWNPLHPSLRRKKTDQDIADLMGRDKSTTLYKKLAAISAEQAEVALSKHNNKMYRASKEYVRKRLADEVKYTPTEYIAPASALEKNAGKLKLLKVFTGETARNAAIGFAAGGVGGNLATATTYPIDTVQMREQLGQPKAKNVPELYQGVGKKLLKNFLHTGIQMGTVGATTALAIKAFSKKTPIIRSIGKFRYKRPL